MSAIYSGQSGLFRATSSLVSRAASIDQLAEDLVGMKIDKVAAEANIQTIRVSDQLMNELVQDHLKK